MENQNVVPSPNSNDYAYALVKGGIGAIPFVGSVASEFFTLTVNPPLQKRMDKWLNSLYSEIEKLKETFDAFQPENLKKNEQFISTVTSATQIALKTHYEEKLIILKNATLNSVTFQDSNFNHSIFLNFIEAFNPIHIKLLYYYFYNKEGSGVTSLRDALIYHDGVQDGPTTVNYLADLENGGLIERNYSISQNYYGPPNPNLFSLSISKLGREFYYFINR